jgi:site-specific DNA recombinase
MTAPMKPIGLYVRVSRKGDRDDDRFHSPREQEERARGLCRARGLVPGPVFADIDVSGATPPDERPGMHALLEALEAGDLGGIAAYSLDRLSREPAHGDALVRRVTAAGGIILTPDIPDAIDTPTGEFTFGMLMQVARLYRSQAAARFASSKERAIAAGIPVTNRDAVGYRRGEDRRYHPDPRTAPHVLEAFQMRARGAGPTEIGEYLGAQGVQTSQGASTWSRQAVHALLRSRTYLGEIRSGPYVNPEAHEPLVDEPLWLAAQNPEQRPVRHRGGSHLLTGILRCAGCGYSMQGTRTSRGKRIYRCQRRHAGGLCPEPARVNADDVEAEVVARFLATADLIYERRGQSPDLAPLEGELESAERRLAQVMTDEARDALGDLWAADVKARREARDAAVAALGEARVEPVDEARIDLVRHWRDEAGLATLRGDGEERAVFLDLSLKRALLADAFPAIAVHRDGTLDYAPNTEGLSRRGFRRKPGLNPL